MINNQIPPGTDIPYKINVVIEIPAYGDPVKYEINKDFDCLSVNRFLATSMCYPCNYGYVPQSLADDGDPLDVLVITPFPLLSGSMISCRPIGMLNMTDESGKDDKILAVPTDNLTDLYRHIKKIHDLPKTTLHSIYHFFEHYKDLEPGKWVKIFGWQDVDATHDMILQAIQNYR